MTTIRIAKNEIPLEPRLYWATQQARLVLKACEVSCLPISPFEIINWFGWGICTVGYIAKTNHISRNKVISGVDSDLYYINGRYYIIYNEKAYPSRIPFTLAHEIGHIWLNHLQDFDLTQISCNDWTKEQYDVLEKEANCFAAELLMPYYIIKKLEPLSLVDLSHFCDVSKTAANNRLKNISKKKGRNRSEIEDIIWMEKQFQNYLEPITFCVNSPLANIIKTCNAETKEMIPVDKKVNYVPTENGRYTICPRCGNTVFSEHAVFCKLCGLFLFNICSESPPDSCSEQCRELPRTNPGDARYCEYCGSPTYLTRKGLISSYQELLESYGQVVAGLDPKIKNEYQETESEKDSLQNINLVDLPF